MKEAKVKPSKPSLFSMDSVGTTKGGKFVNARQEAASKAAKLPGSKGPRSRGGKRVPADVTERNAFKREIIRQGKSASAPTATKPKPAVKPKASPTMVSGSTKRSSIPKAEVSVRDVAPSAKALAPASSGISSKKRDVSIGGLVGRTGGKWHLGKKIGKG